MRDEKTGKFIKGQPNLQHQLKLENEINNLKVLRKVDKPKNRKEVGTYFEFECFCGKKFIAKGSLVKSGKTKSCGCLRLKTAFKSGVENPNWVGKEYEKERNPEFKKWSLEVKQRDNFTCRKCGNNSGGNLVSHHIRGWTKFPNYRFVLDNGITLCEACHKDYHSKHGYKYFTKKSFDKWMVE